MVPKADDVIAGCFEPQRSICIRFLRMLPAIDLNDQPLEGTYEIGNGSPDRHLPAKLQSAELATAQGPPEFVFGVGCVTPKALRVRIGRADRHRPQGRKKPALIPATLAPFRSKLRYPSPINGRRNSPKTIFLQPPECGLCWEWPTQKLSLPPIRARGFTPQDCHPVRTRQKPRIPADFRAKTHGLQGVTCVTLRRRAQSAKKFSSSSTLFGSAVKICRRLIAETRFSW